MNSGNFKSRGQSTESLAPRFILAMLTLCFADFAFAECLNTCMTELGNAVRGEAVDAAAMGECPFSLGVDPGSIIGGTGSKNQAPACHAALYVENPNGTPPGAAISYRQWWKEFIDHQTGTYDPDAGQYGFMNDEILAANYGTHIAAATMAALHAATEAGHSDVQSRSRRWLRNYWALNALSAMPGPTGSVVMHHRESANSTVWTTTTFGSNSSFFDGAIVGSVGGRMEGLTPDPGQVNLYPIHPLFTLAVDFGVGTRRYERTVNQPTNQGWYGGIHVAALLAGKTVDGNGHIVDFAATTDPAVFGLSAAERLSLRQFVASNGSSGLASVVPLIDVTTECRISFVRGATGLATWFGIETMNPDEYELKCSNNPKSSSLGTFWDVDFNGTYLTPLPHGDGGGTLGHHETYAFAGEICTDWSGSGTDICIPAPALDPGQHRSYHVLIGRQGFTIEGDDPTSCSVDGDCPLGSACVAGTCQANAPDVPGSAVSLGNDQSVVTTGVHLVDVLANDSDRLGRPMRIGALSGSCPSAVQSLPDATMLAVDGGLLTDECIVTYQVVDEFGSTLGQASLTLLVSVGDVPPSIDVFTATPNTIPAGETVDVLIEWTISNAEHGDCLGYVNGVQTGAPLELPSAWIYWPQNGTTEYRIDCSWSGGTVSEAIVVEAVNAPIISIWAVPDEIEPGETVLVSWSIENWVDGGCQGYINDVPVGEPLPASGEVEDAPQTTTPYRIDCTWIGGVESAETTVTVVPPADLIANPDQLVFETYATSYRIYDSDLTANDVPNVDVYVQYFTNPSDGGQIVDYPGSVPQAMDYIPAPGFPGGTVTFEYRMGYSTNEEDLSNWVQVVMTIPAPPATASDDGPYPVPHATELEIFHTELLANDVGSGLVIHDFPTLPVNGTFDPSDPIRFTPDQGYSGPDSFTYRARDAGGSISNPATVQINVTPVAVDDEVPMCGGSTLVIPHGYLLANDGGSNLAFDRIIDPPLNGIVVLEPGQLVYHAGSPGAKIDAVDVFTYRAHDEHGQKTDPATIRIKTLCTGTDNTDRRRLFWTLLQGWQSSAASPLSSAKQQDQE